MTGTMGDMSLAPTPQQQIASATQAAGLAAKVNAADALPAPVNYTLYGDTIPLLFGRARVLGAPLWASPVVTNSDGSRTLSAAYSFGKRDPRAGAAQVTQIYIDETLVYDTTADPPLTTPFSFTLYDGSPDQPQDPTIVASEGANRTPGFRDLIYIVMKDYTVPAGSNFPQMTAVIVQTLSNVGKSPVIPFQAGDANSRTNFLCDYEQGLIYTTYGSTLDIYSMVQRAPWQKLTLPIGHFDLSWGVCVSRFDGAFIAQAGTGQNGEELLVFDRTNGSTLCTFGANGSSLNSGPTNLGLSADMISLGKIMDNDEVILSASIIAELAAINRKNNALTYYNVWDTGAGNTNMGMVEKIDLSRSSMKNFDPTQFAMVFASTTGKLWQLLIVPTGSTGVIGTRTISYTSADGAFTSGANTGLKAYLTNGTQNLTATEGLVEITGVLGATETIVFMTSDRDEGKWLSAIVHDSSSGNYYFRKWATCYSQLGTIRPGNTNGVPNDPPAMPATNFIALLVNQQLTGVPAPAFGRDMVRCARFRPVGQTKMAYASGSQLTIIDMASGSTAVYASTTFTKEDGTTWGGSPHWGGYINYYDALREVFYSDLNITGGEKPGLTFVPGAGDPGGGMKLSDFCTSLGVLAEYDETDIVTTSIDDELTGAIINTQVKFLDILNRVALLFRFDVLESQGKLKFQRKTRGTGFTIDRVFTQADLAPVNQGNANDGMLIDKTRNATSALPRQLNVLYLDADNGFQIGQQIAKRTQFPQKTSAGTYLVTADVPIAMTAGQALYWGTFSLYDMWAGALTFAILTSIKNGDIECGDFCQVNLDDGSQYLTKCVSKTLNGDFSVSLELSTILATAPDMQVVPAAAVELAALVATGSSAIDNTASTSPTDAATALDYSVASSDTGGTTTYSLPPPSIYFVDNVLPNEADDVSSGFMCVIMASLSADLYEQTGESYFFATNDVNPPNFALSKNALGSVDRADYPDEINTLTVIPGRGIPASVSQADFIAGKNAFLIGDSGRWEMVYFRDVTNNGDGTLTLSHFLRGRRGTDAVIGQAAAGDPVLFLNSGEYGTIDFDASQVGASVGYMSLPSGYPQTSTFARKFAQTMNAANKKPWKPVNLTASPSGSDIVLAWTRRDRTDSDLHDGDDTTPMSEATESYSVTIYKTDETTIARTVTASSPTYTYLAADQATDGFSGGAIKFSVAQISALVGNGNSEVATCPII